VAISASTTLSGFSGFLTPEQSGAIFEKTYKSSVVQQLAQRIPLGLAGVTVPVVTGRLTAGWVAEGAQKPASQGTLSLKTMTPKKIATIAVVSAEVVRANPGNYMNIIQDQVAEAFAIAFDSAVLHGTAMAPTVATTNLTTVTGYGGDWTQVAWGQIGGISYDVSSQSTVTINGSLVSLWENNLIGVRAETEFGFLANDVQAFVRLTNTTGS
jgi:HK97 family phage major capsid protein